MKHLRIGTTGYNYREWRGSFYPHDLPDTDQLRFYSSRFPTVELNYTFHKAVTVRLLQGWAKEVPDDFAFSLKAPRRITHDLKLRDAADLVADFFDVAGALRAKLGVILFQIPPFLKRDLPRLEDFLHQTPPGCRVAVEFRNASWFSDDVYECLRRFGVAMVISEGPERDTPWTPTADFGYFRLRQPVYTDDELRICAERISFLAVGWRDVFVYFKHEAGAHGPAYGARLAEFLRDAGPAAVAEAG